MLHDDSSLRDLDQKVNQMVDIWQNMPGEEKEELLAKVSEVMDLLEGYDLSNPTPETEAMLERLRDVMGTLRIVTAQSMYRRALAYMNKAKEEADKGDETAKEVYAKLHQSWMQIQAPKDDQIN